MQESKNKRLLILLGVLICTTSIAWLLINADSEPVVDKQIFQVENLDEINEVKLTSSEGTVDLKFNGSRWLVNEKYTSEARMIEVLFATLKQAEPKRPVAISLRDSIAQALKMKGVRVTLFQGQDIVKDFYAGGNELKTQAYFLDPVSNEVYVITIPGYRVYVSGIFELDETGFRDKYVFGFNWRNFRSLSAEFPGNPKENFTISLNKDFFTIEGQAKVDTAKLNAFLDRVSLLTVDQYINSTSLTDSLDNIKPFMKISIGDIASRSYSLSLFLSREGGKVAGMVGDQPVYFDPARIKPILLPKSFFLTR
jgi:hypothetical protein